MQLRKKLLYQIYIENWKLIEILKLLKSLQLLNRLENIRRWFYINQDDL